MSTQNGTVPATPFQSSPGHVTGRYAARPSGVVSDGCVSSFQSSPGHVTGRYLASTVLALGRSSVSILARSRDRALHAAAVQDDAPEAVSILARSRDRALHRRDDRRDELPVVSILARSRDRALRSRMRAALERVRFQSS